MESNNALSPVAAEKAKCLFDREEFSSEGFSRKYQCPAPHPAVRQNLTTSQPAHPATVQRAPARIPQPRTTPAPSPPIPIASPQPQSRFARAHSNRLGPSLYLLSLRVAVAISFFFLG